MQQQWGDASASFTYRGCGYGVTQQRPEGLLVGNENAILDYRYSRDPRLTWFFDHHRTAFQLPGDREHFLARSACGQLFFDADCSSCTKLIRDVARDRFGIAMTDLDDLVDWADRIDSARFDSAEAAIGRDDPVKQLAKVVEHRGNDAFLNRLVPQLLERPLSEVASSATIRDHYRPLGKRLEQFRRQVEDSAVRLGRVVFVDLTAKVVEGLEKFVTYSLYPDAVYSVVVGLRRADVNISVGYNPWSGTPRDTDISAICARHGGGGHPVVGAISLEREQLERARGIARSIAQELAG